MTELRTREAIASDAKDISTLANEAFIEGDAFFKKPQYRKRVDDDGEDVQSILANNNETFLVVEDISLGVVVGTVHVHWPEQMERVDGFSVGHFGMMSVPKRCLVFLL